MEFFTVTAMGVQLYTEIKRLAIYLISRHTLVTTLAIQDCFTVVCVYGAFTKVEDRGPLTIFK
jgi:hypothetical protein